MQGKTAFQKVYQNETTFGAYRFTNSKPDPAIMSLSGKKSFLCESYQDIYKMICLSSLSTVSNTIIDRAFQQRGWANIIIGVIPLCYACSLKNRYVK